MFAVGEERFQLLGQVGQGGYGVVYKARDLRSERDVAIKLLHETGGSAGTRFDREAALLAELRHPGIVQYVAHGKAHDGRQYLVMEWLEGETLQDRMARTLLPLGDCLRLAMRVVAALAYAETKGVIHRDIKPANLFLVGGALAEAKLLDFGLARRVSDRQQLTRTGLLVGTPLYMSPEQARGDHAIDTRTDVFSLASVLYEGLTGQPPFEAFNDLGALAKVCFDEPLPLEQLMPELPAALCELLRAMHRKDRQKRPSYAQIAEQLSQIAEHVQAAQPAPRRPDATTLLAGQAATLSMRADLQQRVLCALVLGGNSLPTSRLHEALQVMAEARHVRLERLVDGSHILLLDEQLAASEQAVAAGQLALGLRELLPAAPIVVCTGRARMAGPLPFGELVERAVQLLLGTSPGQTRLDDASAAQLMSRFELTGPSGARELVRERSDTDAPNTVLGHATRFVGRERELSSLQLLFGECVDDQVARAALVVAPAGAGKSRLRYELVERLRASGPVHVLTARGDAMRTGTPFGLIAPLLRGWAQLASGDSPERKREKLRARVAQLLGSEHAPLVGDFLAEMLGFGSLERESPQLTAARRDPQLMADQVLDAWLRWLDALALTGPVLLAVEDLHWADPGSLRFLEAALSSLANRPLLVVGFARPELREHFPGLWAERDVMELRLPKLAQRACEQLLAAIAEPGWDAGLLRYLVERADGNPFVLEELVRGARERAGDRQLPDTVLGIVQARLDGLGEDPKLLIRAASVFGQGFRVEAVRALLGGAAARFDLASCLALLVEREVIFRKGTGATQEYAFRHALIRDAAYLLLPDEERALGHRLAGQWLLQQQDSEPALLADHFERGGALPQAAHFYCAAAAASLDAGSLDDVVRCGERAAACGAGERALGEVAAAVAEALSFSGEDARALQWAETARAALSIGEPAWWRASQVAAITYVRHGSPALDRVLSEMLDNSPVEPTLPEQVIALGYLAGECVRTLQQQLARRVLAFLPTQLPPGFGGRAQGCIESARATEAFGQGNLSGALHHARRALGEFRAAGALKDVAGMLNIKGFLLLELGCHEEAEQAFTEEVQLGQRIASQNDVWSATQNLGVSYLTRGRLEEAERALQSSADGFGRLEMVSFQVLSLVHLAALQMARGQLELAASGLERALAMEPVEDAARALGLALQARLWLLRGDPLAARASMTVPAELLRSGRVLEHAALLRTTYVECLVANGEVDEARAAAAEALRWLEARAAQIEDATLRESFLSRVPENARITALAPR